REPVAMVLQRGLPRPVRVLDDGNHGLAGDVPTEDHDVGLVERPRVQELLPADLRTVEIGHEEDLHRWHLPPAKRPGASQRLRRTQPGASDRPPPGARTTASGPPPWPAPSTSASLAPRRRTSGGAVPGPPARTASPPGAGRGATRRRAPRPCRGSS